MAKLQTNAEQVLRGFARIDPELVQELTDAHVENLKQSGLDPKIYSLVKIAALVAENASEASYMWQVANAVENGVKPEQITGLLVALTPTVGMARIVSAAPKIGDALGYEISEYLESTKEKPVKK